MEQVSIKIATLETRVKSLEDSRETVMESLKDLAGELKTKVSTTAFYWIIGILISLFLAAFGYIVKNQEFVNLRLDKIYEKTNSTQQDVSTIKGKLEPYDIIFKN